MASVSRGVEPSGFRTVNVYDCPSWKRGALGRHDFPVVYGQEDVAWADARAGRDSARVDVLEDPAQPVVRVGLHERRRDGDSSGGARPAFVEEPGVARAEGSEHRVHRGFELLGRLAASDGLLVLLPESGGIRLGSHELGVDQVEDPVEDRAALGFVERGHRRCPPRRPAARSIGTVTAASP